MLLKDPTIEYLMGKCWASWKKTSVKGYHPFVSSRFQFHENNRYTLNFFFPVKADMWCFPIELFGGPNWGRPSRYFDLKRSPWENYDPKYHDLSEPCDIVHPNRPPIMYQKRGPTIFFLQKHR